MARVLGGSDCRLMCHCYYYRDYFINMWIFKNNRVMIIVTIIDGVMNMHNFDEVGIDGNIRFGIETDGVRETVVLSCG